MARLGKGFWLAVVLPGLFGFDFWTKDWVRDNLEEGGAQIPVIPGWVSLWHAENPDILFSLPMPVPVIFVGGAVALIVLAITWWQLPSNARMQSAALAAVAAGALGNLVDRIPDGTVTDMVRLYTDYPPLSAWLVDTFRTNTWPIFNVADVALLGGVGVWLIGDLLRSDPQDGAALPEG